MKTVICYHTDLDGHLSGAILQHHLSNQSPIMVRMDYNDEFPWDLIDGDTEVWMADFSLQPWSEMARLQETCKQLIWIDHHKTAIADYQGWISAGNTPIHGIRIDGRAACRLCWNYCNPEIKEPRAVYLAGVYDVWTWQNVKGAIEFQYGTKLYETDPATEAGRNFWEEQFAYPMSAYTQIITQGQLLKEYEDRSNASFIKENSFEIEFHGLNVVAVNRKGSSQQFDAVWDPEKHHFMLTFAWAKGAWTVSMYTNRKDVDVGSIAKQHGGGGHRGAAGFVCKELPFILK